jgi:protein-tyrosine-phosphatase
MAEGIARHVIKERYKGRLEACSAGVAGLEGEPASMEAVRVLAERGIDIRGHVARSVSSDLVKECDIALVMEERHARTVDSFSRAAGARLLSVLLMRLAEVAQVALDKGGEGMSSLAPEQRLEALLSVADIMNRNSAWDLPFHEYEVPDPIGMPEAEYARVADMIQGPIESLVTALLG